jgi:hypothetical protein
MYRVNEVSEFTVSTTDMPFRVILWFSPLPRIKCFFVVFLNASKNSGTVHKISHARFLPYRSQFISSIISIKMLIINKPFLKSFPLLTNRNRWQTSSLFSSQCCLSGIEPRIGWHNPNFS